MDGMWLTIIIMAIVVLLGIIAVTDHKMNEQLKSKRRSK